MTRGAWLLSADADRGWVDGGHAPGPLKRAYGWYLRFWYFGIIHDPELVKRFFRVVHMVGTPTSLLNPLLVRRLARYSKRGRRRARRRAGSSPR